MTYCRTPRSSHRPGPSEIPRAINGRAWNGRGGGCMPVRVDRTRRSSQDCRRVRTRAFPTPASPPIRPYLPALSSRDPSKTSPVGTAARSGGSPRRPSRTRVALGWERPARRRCELERGALRGRTFKCCCWPSRGHNRASRGRKRTECRGKLGRPCVRVRVRRAALDLQLGACPFAHHSIRGGIASLGRVRPGRGGVGELRSSPLGRRRSTLRGSACMWVGRMTDAR
ncbi:hypothetical protein BC628DRAFT_743920 [Trametes gibbosa]|nr:hypothetical protein BC628DRAFT_743920 [Trametes gibbosa]